MLLCFSLQILDFSHEFRSALLGLHRFPLVECLQLIRVVTMLPVHIRKCQGFNTASRSVHVKSLLGVCGFE